jgi:hypothetical protein
MLARVVDGGGLDTRHRNCHADGLIPLVVVPYGKVAVDAVVGVNMGILGATKVSQFDRMT